VLCILPAVVEGINGFSVWMRLREKELRQALFEGKGFPEMLISECC
jgi:hypothetical protein